MLSAWMLSALAVGYLGVLFAIAFFGDRHQTYLRHARLRPYIYSLALGVYCTSWTFFGAVGTAQREGWSYLPIYLGPSLLVIFAPPLLHRLIQIAQDHKVTSIADLVAVRFGKSRPLAVMVTLIAATAAVPYLALQYKAVAASVATLTGGGSAHTLWYRDTALAVALLMALFAVLFGARRIDASEHRAGLMLAIAFESLLKLLAFAAIGLFAAVRWYAHPVAMPAQLAAPDTFFTANALMNTVLAAAAIICLPRQFQIGVVECADTADLRTARWLLPAYLGVFSLFVLPIVAAGASTGSHASADMLILNLPIALGARSLALLVFLGGLSAATAMVVVSSIALSTMIANELIAPLLWRQHLAFGEGLARRVLWVRRLSIFALALLAFIYYRSTTGSGSLAAIGLLAFAAVAQFAPAIVAGSYWSGTSRTGVFWGMVVGFALWCSLLLLPTLAGDMATAAHPHLSLRVPPGAGTEWVGLRAMLALAANALTLVAVSSLRRVSLQERLAARAVLAGRRAPPALQAVRAQVGDLQAVAARIVGPAAAQQAILDYAASAQRAPPRPGDLADRALLQQFERVLSAALGASSARVVLTHALRQRGLEVDEVAALLDQTSQELRFSRQLLLSTIENVTQGISVVDAEMRIVAWNQRYVDLFGYPDGMVYVGRPVADLIRFNAEQGELGPGDVEQQIERRLAHMRAGTAHAFQRVRRDGRVYSIQGQPIAGGGFVTTYSDVTEFKRTEQALLETKRDLELRVHQRTQELSIALEAQRQAKSEAEAANAGKTRFVAAASHDLLQPLNAARLFAAALEARVASQPDLAELATRVGDSMRAAEEMLRDLLDIARLDSGAIRPEHAAFPLHELLEELHRQYASLARGRGLRLTMVPSRLWVDTDRVMLRRIVQNLLSNALRYTERGGVLLGCRRHEGEVEILVCDTGPGIAEDKRTRLFAEFSNLGGPSPWGERGSGLGLSICERFAQLLRARLTLRSVPGRGSSFGVRIACRAAHHPVPTPSPAPQPPSASLRGRRALCIDNDPVIPEGMRALLSEWGLIVTTARSAAEARARCRDQSFDVILADYHLNEPINGLALLLELQAGQSQRPAGAIVTADHGAELARAVVEAGLSVMHKPVRAGALHGLLLALLPALPAAAPARVAGPA